MQSLPRCKPRRAVTDRLPDTSRQRHHNIEGKGLLTPLYLVC